jgi:Protein of unknown function (DUF2721)
MATNTATVLTPLLSVFGAAEFGRRNNVSWRILAHVFSLCTGRRPTPASDRTRNGPAFVLGAVAGSVSILMGRLTAIIERIRHLNEISDDEGSHARLKVDLPRLRRHARMLNNATRLVLGSGMCASLLLVVAFGSAFLRLQHVYGACALFLLAVGLLGVSLFKFGQEVGRGLSDADHYR